MGTMLRCLQTTNRRITLKRFSFGDDEESDDEMEEEKFMQGPEFFSMAQFPFDGGGNGILDSSIKICENSIFWKFYSTQTKLSKIKETYVFLLNLEEEGN